MNQPGDEAKDRTARNREPELLPYIVGIGALAGPIACTEGLRQLRAEARVPTFIDAVDDSRQLRRVGTDAKQAFQPTAEFRLGDLLRVGRADGGQVRGVDEAALEEGQLVVELQPVDMEGALGRSDPAQRLPREESLIGEVMDGQDRGDLGVAP